LGLKRSFWLIPAGVYPANRRVHVMSLGQAFLAALPGYCSGSAHPLPLEESRMSFSRKEGRGLVGNFGGDGNGRVFVLQMPLLKLF